MSARHAIAAALLLATSAGGALAQDDDAAALHNVAGIKASSGIAPDLFAKLEAFRPATPPPLQATLHRVVLKRVIAREGKEIGTDRRTIEFLPDAPGYLFEVATPPGTVNTFLEYGPFLTVESHLKRHVTQTFPHLDIDTTATTRITNVTLPPSFDAALTPRAVWQMESESDTAITSKNVMKSIDRSNFKITRRTCTTSERQPARVVSPSLLGTAVFITCQQPDQAGDDLSMAYLDAYGVFFPVALAFKQAPAGTAFTNTFTVERVDVDAPPAGTLIAEAPVATPTAAALPSLEEARAEYRRHDDAKAFKDLGALAESGEVHAQILLAVMYMDGRGTPVDKAASAKWTIKAAEQGLAVAQAAAGVDYRDGVGVPVDPQAAFGWFLKAAQQGNPEAQGEVGTAYFSGVGVAKDVQAGLAWTLKAATQGALGAEANLGIAYSGKLGLPADFPKAAMWSRRAADRGSVEGQAQLCFLYARGAGVPQDNEQAEFWCVLASNSGSALAKTNRALLESQMPAAQRARIIARTLEWKPVAASAPPTP